MLRWDGDVDDARDRATGLALSQPSHCRWGLRRGVLLGNAAVPFEPRGPRSAGAAPWNQRRPVAP